VRTVVLANLLVIPSCISHAQVTSQPVRPYYARKNTFGVFFAYSGDSSHMLLGYAVNRRLLDIGAAYNRRLILDHVVNWQYSAEILPVALESDPVESRTYTYTFSGPPGMQTETEQLIYAGACHAAPGSGSVPGFYSYTYTATCERRWTMGEAMSPAGFQWNFRPRRKLQPFLVAHGGYMFSTRPIPVPQAGSFNFTFDVGAGIEIFRARTRSIRAGYRYHHVSNSDTANQNPGIDSGLLQFTYSFGR